MNELRDIHLPPSISSPNYLLWIGLALLIAIIIYWIRPTLRKEALRVLSQIEKEFAFTGDTLKCLTQVSELMRRVVLSKKGAEIYAATTGPAWLEVLDRSFKEPKFREIGQILLEGPYQKEVRKGDVDQLLRLCKQWVKRQ